MQICERSTQIGPELLKFDIWGDFWVGGVDGWGGNLFRSGLGRPNFIIEKNLAFQIIRKHHKKAPYKFQPSSIWIKNLSLKLGTDRRHMTDDTLEEL